VLLLIDELNIYIAGDQQMKNFDVIIIGGGPAGIITGVTGIKQNNGKAFLMIKEEEKGLVPCGIPYIFHEIGSVDGNVMGPKPFVDAGGEVLNDSVVSIDLDQKIVKTASGANFEYDKLVFATGSTPIVPKFIEGYDLDGVEYIMKSYNKMTKIKEKADSAENIVVIGGGFIGVEVAEQLSKESGKTVSLIEKEKYCLSRAFSENSCINAAEYIVKSGVKLYTGVSVKKIEGVDGKVKRVVLADGTKIDADIVIAAIGYKPRVDLAKSAGLALNSNGAIIVDNYLRTSVKDVYSAGDCAGTKGFITGSDDNIMLASTATSEARILGYNLYSIKIRNNMAGTLSVFSTEINGKVFASAGAIEQSAKDANIDFVVGTFKDVDRHPATFKDTSSLQVKLVVSPGDGVIIGSEICGGKTVGELINVIALAIQKSVSVYELISFQIGTHPLLTGAPTKYVLIKAAESAISKLNNRGVL